MAMTTTPDSPHCSVKELWVLTGWMDQSKIQHECLRHCQENHWSYSPLPHDQHIRISPDVPDLPANPHQNRLVVQEQHLQDSRALAHCFDIIWEKDGSIPLCKKKSGDPYYEPWQ